MDLDHGNVVPINGMFGGMGECCWCAPFYALFPNQLICPSVLYKYYGRESLVNVDCSSFLPRVQPPVSSS